MSVQTRPAAGRVEIEIGVPFGVGGDLELLCDIYHPPAPNGTGILLLFGGAWRAGRREQLRGYGILLGRIGYTCVCAEYRLSDGPALDYVDTDERLKVGARWPAQLHDAKTAIRWMRSEAARLRIEPDRIVAMGFSAGGHLALMAAGTADDPRFEGDGSSAGASSRLAAVVAYYPPTDLRLRPPGQFLVSQRNLAAFFGDDGTEQALRAASPVSYARPDFPPTLLIHGTADRLPGDDSDQATVSHRSSMLMYEALEAAGAPVELHLLAGLPHMFDLDRDLARMGVTIVDQFLSRMLPRPG